jgi:hypothetical protein
MQQNANIAEITNPIVMESARPNPIEFINGRVLEVIASVKSTGDKLDEKTRKIDEKLKQIDDQFQLHLEQLRSKIYSEIEQSQMLSAKSLNEIEQLWKTRLNETAEIYACESRQIIANVQRDLSESIGTLNGDSERALQSYVNRLEAQLIEAKEQHKCLITDLKTQLLNDFESFIKETRQELDSTKKGAKDVFDQRLETLLKSLSDSTKEVEKNKTVVDRFVEQTRVSLQSMVGEFQSQHDLKINQSAVKFGELESKANSLLETTHSEFENRWLGMVNTHNENLKSFRDSLKEAVVAKVAQHAKKRLDFIINEFQADIDRISKNQEALKLEIISLNKKGQNDYAQIESTMNKLQRKLTDEKKKSQLWILFITLIFSSIFIYSHYFNW